MAFRELVGNLKKGSTSAHVGKSGVVIVDTHTNQLLIQDGMTPGGVLPAIAPGAGTTVAASISATGSNQSTALRITNTLTVFTIVAAGTGAQLPTTLNVVYTVINRGLNPLLIYPPSNAQIESGSLNVAVSVAIGATTHFIGVSATQFYAY